MTRLGHKLLSDFRNHRQNPLIGAYSKIFIECIYPVIGQLQTVKWPIASPWCHVWKSPVCGNGATYLATSAQHLTLQAVVWKEQLNQAPPPWRHNATKSWHHTRNRTVHTIEYQHRTSNFRLHISANKSIKNTCIWPPSRGQYAGMYEVIYPITKIYKYLLINSCVLWVTFTSRKLHAYGVSPDSCDPQCSHSTNRTHRVKISTVKSRWAKLIKGIP